MTATVTAAPDLAPGPGIVEWQVWTTTARVVVTDPAALAGARAIVASHLAAVGSAASRFRPDSEVSRLAGTGTGRPVRVSAVLADLVATALETAERTGGAVDPTVGSALVGLGYDRDLADVSATTRPVGVGRAGAGPRVSWRDVRLTGRELTVPAGVLLDLGATAKARAADHGAALAHAELGCGVLVSLGGDLRVAGPGPDGGWEVLVQDGPDEPASQIRLQGAQAVATSSTLHRTWEHGGRRLHHILDPVTGLPAAPVWRTVTVAAATCAAANTLTTAAVVRGPRALELLGSAGVPARLVAADGTVTRLGGWPT